MKTFAFVILVLVIAGSCSCFTYNEKLAQELAGYSMTSYCHPKLIEEWKCGYACDQNPEGLADVKVLYNSTMNASGFLGYSKTNDAIIVTFRGTVPWSIKNWVSDINTFKVEYPNCDNNCSVHKGFYKHFQNLESQLVTEFKVFREKYPDSKVFVTGHSLGAALSAHSIPILYELNGNKPIDVLYNYGSPRVGDEDYSTWFVNQNFITEFARITNGKDPVPHLPPHITPFKFTHYGQEVFYKSFKKHGFKHTQCEESESLSCAEGEKFAVNIPDHLRYFGYDWSKAILSCQLNI